MATGFTRVEDCWRALLLAGGEGGPGGPYAAAGRLRGAFLALMGPSAVVKQGVCKGRRENVPRGRPNWRPGPELPTSGRSRSPLLRRLAFRVGDGRGVDVEPA